METIFLNTGNSKKNETHKFRLTLAGKSNLKDPNTKITFANVNIYYTWKKY